MTGMLREQDETDVSDVLRDRMQRAGGLQRMAVVSVLVHRRALAALVCSPPADGSLSQPRRPPRTVMTISLGGGSARPQTGGMTSDRRPAGQAVSRPRRRSARSRSGRRGGKTPEMTVPAPEAEAPSEAAPNRAGRSRRPTSARDGRRRGARGDPRRHADCRDRRTRSGLRLARERRRRLGVDARRRATSVVRSTWSNGEPHPRELERARRGGRRWRSSSSRFSGTAR